MATKGRLPKKYFKVLTPLRLLAYPLIRIRYNCASARDVYVGPFLRTQLLPLIAESAPEILKDAPLILGLEVLMIGLLFRKPVPENLH